MRGWGASISEKFSRGKSANSIFHELAEFSKIRSELTVKKLAVDKRRLRDCLTLGSFLAILLVIYFYLVVFFLQGK